MFYSEINKIIEAGLTRDTEKVKNYSKLLAEKLKDDGEIKAHDRILNLLKNKYSPNIGAENLVATPVDNESRLDILEITNEKLNFDLILSPYVKAKLEEFEKYIKNIDIMLENGIESNMSLLLYGEPGCGKTSIAYYLAEKLKFPLVIAKLDTMISSLLGNTSKNIKKIFDYSKRNPCILFLDEFDAIAKSRSDEHENGELKRVVNGLLQNIDDYSKNNILIAATNHHNLLDSAIWRRFDYIINIPNPEIDEIKETINAILKKTNITNDFILDDKKENILVSLLYGYSYSTIKTILQNTIKKSIINKKNNIRFIDILFEIFYFKKNGNFNNKDLINYLCKHGVSQKQTSEYLNISTRQVRNNIIDKE